MNQLSEEQTELLHRVLDHVLEVNKQFNLTAIRDPEVAWTKHVLDSLQGLETGLFTNKKSVIDVGAGAGFPSLVLAAACPDLRVTALDSTRKKCDFIKATSEQFELGMRVINGRAEDTAQSKVWRERYDLGIARAVGSMSEVCELVLPLVRVGGHAVLWRGENAREETKAANNAIRKLGGKIGANAFIEYSLPDLPLKYHIVVIEKVSLSPAQYPRRNGLPKSKPLD